MILRIGAITLTALAFAIVVGLAMTTGGGQAQATDNTPTPTFTATPTPEPFPTPEACSTPTAHVIDSGHYALFDVYWDENIDRLTTNPCPPTVTVTRHVKYEDDEEVVTYTHARTASNAKVATTVFHVPGDADNTLRANNDVDYGKWPYLYPNAKDTNGDGTTAGDEIGAPFASVWTLPDCSPEDDAPTPTPNDLCIGFSAELLRTSDWVSVNYRFETIREPGLAPADWGRAFVFYRPGTEPTDAPIPIWKTGDPDSNQIDIEVGEHLHPQWAFTGPGTYKFQVHAQGRPKAGNAMVLPPGTIGVTSLIKTYTIHVGDLSDVGVTITADDSTPDTGDEVAYTITASNAGPDTAADAEVAVTLPAGLTYHSSSTATGTYDSATGVWSVGDLIKDASATLTLNATTGDDTHGKALTVTAKIQAYEDIGTSTVDELDTDESDNTATVTVTPVSDANAAPIFRLTRSVAENSAAATAVGAAVPVYEPDSGDTLTFGLAGSGADQFAVAADTDGNAQVSVATDASLDYETTDFYNLTLTVSDGKDAAGNADASVDNSVGLLINVTDVDEPVTRSIAENSASGTDVGAVAPISLGSGAGTTTYTLTGTGAANFSVASATGGAQISVATGASLDYETTDTYSLTLTASDGATSKSVSVTINVTDVNEPVTRSIAENSLPGTNVGAVAPISLGSGAGTTTYTLTGTGADKFSAAPATGGAQISVAAGASINYEDGASYSLALTATDGTLSKSVSVTITVTDVATEALRIGMSADRSTQTVGGDVILTARVISSPVATDQLSYSYNERNANAPHDPASGTQTGLTRTVTWTGSSVWREYTITVSYTDEQDVKQEATSNSVEIVWNNPGG